MSKSKQGKNNRRKGHQWERDLANELKKIGFPEACRHLEYQTHQARGYDLEGASPFKIQCKNSKTVPNFETVFEEIDAEEFEFKVLAYKKPNKGKYAIMPMDDFLRLLEDLL